VQRHSPRAYAIAYRVLRNRQDAEDAVQESLAAAYMAIGSFDVRRPFLPWLGCIVLRKSLNAVEKRRLRTSEELTENSAVCHRSPFEDIVQSQLAAQVRLALTQLSPRQRSIVELVELEGHSSAEAATMLGISPATARWHLHEARGTLRKLLQVANPQLN
jgi:RNA polymerase sigma-70 factor (ECF subfamily)